MKEILVASFDMAIGGVERSLIGLLNNMDYNRYKVDLMLYKHEGEFLPLIPEGPYLLPEVPQYATFRKSVGEVLKGKHYFIGLSRILSKLTANLAGRINGTTEPGYYQMQLMWKNSLPFIPRIFKEYDVAISYLWPHYFVADKVTAKTKIAWIHTDYSTIETDEALDAQMWKKFNYIIAVSEECKKSFVKKYGELEHKVVVIENITSPWFIKKMADEEDADNPMINDRRFKILTVGRLSHAKGIDLAVKALKVLTDRGYHDIAWYVVGYGGDEDKIKELISENNLNNSFILLGKRTNPYPFMKACDLYVQPSRYEGKAVTVTEAKILSKPVLITNYPTAGSQVQDGIDGVICETGPAGLADGIVKLFETRELRSTLINNISDRDYSNSYELDKLYSIIGD